MTDTDIAALVERLRDTTKFETWENLTGLIAEAADALEALQHTQDMFTADFNDCNSERARWKARAEKAEAALKKISPTSSRQ